MTEREQTEQAIRQILETEVNAVYLSDRLFAPDGLFSRLASTDEERRLVVRSALFQQAQKRLSELQEKDLQQFTKVLEQVRAILPEGYSVKLEPCKRS